MRIGILGNGQLGMMMALAAYPMGHRVRFFAPAPGDSTEGLGEQVLASYEDLDALRRFAAGLDVVTYEFENVDLVALQTLATMVPVYPSIEALAKSRDRVVEKTFFGEIGAQVPQFRAVSSEADLQRAIRELGTPAVLKTRRFGYDGKGQALLRTAEDGAQAWQELGKAPDGLVLESFVHFDREVSLIGVRSRGGDMKFYPLVQNHHRAGILSRTLAPAPEVDAALQSRAEGVAAKTMEALDYVGVLTIEFFQVGQDLLVNEIAPRVHNSGHWTIEGAVTSQFANHIRAVCGAPLGATALRGPSDMFNLVGSMPAREAVQAIPGAYFHDYGKAPKPGRKLGHITVNLDGGDIAASVAAVAKLSS